MQQSELDDYQFSGVEEPWKDESILKRLYCEENMTYAEIAERLGTSESTVSRYVDKSSIEPRSAADRTKLDQLGGPDELERLYLDEELTQQEIADKFGVHRNTVGRWIQENGLALTDLEVGRKGALRRRFEYPRFCVSTDGYERWEVTVDFYEKAFLQVHRLIAVAEYGFDAVCDMHVHHKNHIPWDNRPENLELMSPSDHISYHQRVRSGRTEPPWVSDD